MPTRNRKIILGIDTSLRSSGWAVVEARGSAMISRACGTIKNAPKLPHSQCLLNIRTDIERCCREYEPTAAAIEGAFFAKNAKTAMILGQARGVVIATCAAAGMPVFEYSPRRVKQALVGSGSVSKQQVAAMVRRLLNLKDDLGDDESDAFAIAICHLQRNSKIPGMSVEPI